MKILIEKKHFEDMLIKIIELSHFITCIKNLIQLAFEDYEYKKKLFEEVTQ